jgi:hypothetical protein
MEIQQLSETLTVSAGDLLPIYAANAGSTRKLSLTTLVAFIQSLVVSTDNKLTQYAAPSATGFTVAVNNDNKSVWLILTPVAGYAAGTLVLPLLQNCIDKQELLFNTTQAVTALTINGNGSTVTGAPTALTANQTFKLRFDGVTKTWYNIV